MDNEEYPVEHQFEIIKELDTDFINRTILKGIPNPYVCSICKEDTMFLVLKEHIRIPNITSAIASAGEIYGVLNKIPNECLFKTCQYEDHLICSGCFKKLSQRAITERQGRAKCVCPNVFTGEDCDYEFSDKIVKSILTKKEYSMYKQMVRSSPHKTRVYFECPGCNDEHYVTKNDIKDCDLGEMIVGCAVKENYYYCYDCKVKQHGVTYEMDFDELSCSVCIQKDEENNPEFINRYFSGFKKNKDLTVGHCVAEIKEVLLQKEFNYIKCFECGIRLEKSEKCNTLSHCGIERCYSCGRSGTRERPFLGDHWSETGVGGCPRWDTATYWNKTAKCDFKCVEDVCYSYHLGKCSIPEHKDGILKMEETRRFAFMYHQLTSLNEELSTQVIELLSKEKENVLLMELFKNKNNRKKDYTPNVN